MKLTTISMKVFPLILLFAALVLSSCAGVGAAAVKPTGLPDACLEEISGAKSLVNQAHGYCLLYPDGYDIISPNPDEIDIVVGSLLDVEHPRVIIKVANAAGGDVNQAADKTVADFPGFDIWLNDGLKIDGKAAVVLDRIPGQDLSRQVLVVHGGRLYKLIFLPSDESMGDVYNQMKLLHKTVTNSFRFVD
jgi:hypothetical protein